MTTPVYTIDDVATSAGLSACAGFDYAGVAAGLKASGGLDVAVVRNLGPEFTASAVFTTNRFAAAPVLWSREVASDHRVDAIVLNSGGANACTGAEGFGNTHRTAELAGESLGVAAGDVLICSTGLIGEQLPMDLLEAGVARAAGELSSGNQADLDVATAIMTTDTVPKRASITIHTDAGEAHIGGVAKGAGMLAPGLATMLVVLTTDASLDEDTADAALRRAVEYSVNRVDSDGCMSTNDTVALMASGASGVEPNAQEFGDALTAVCQSLALQLIGDAEGASHDVHVTTLNAATEAQALEVSRAVARSNLVKCAIFGNDPNWGRILSEVGTTRADYDPEDVAVSINGVTICRGGEIGEDRSLVDLAANRQVQIDIDLGAGRESARIWTNDLTHDYVEENSAYSS